METNNNKRLAKNTLLLYFRMLLIMGVTLYTVRVVLNTLGVIDYGIYNVVGGVVTAFSFLSATMASATQRFFSYELGRKDFVKLNNLFSLSVLIYIGIAIAILILAETLGLWFLNNKLNLPVNRVDAANWVYQFSILTFMMTMMKVPYDAAIIARERMSVYAYISIIEVILKLAVVYFLLLFTMDKLKLYAVLIFIITGLITLIFKVYCNRAFEESRFKWFWDKTIFKELVSYSGWNLFGTLTAVSFDQGINFLLNIFFGPIVNAARGISYQVNNAIGAFSSNFYTAIRPQIIKSYAEGNTKYLMQLVFKSSKYSFFLLLVISTPILLDTDFILTLWLKSLPANASLFVQLTVIFNLLNSLQIPLTTAVQATGNIKKYQIYVGFSMLMCLPLTYTLLKFNYPPESAYYVMISVSAIALIFRLKILKGQIFFKYIDYIGQVLIRLVSVSIVPILLTRVLTTNMPLGFTRFFIVCILSTLFTITSIAIFGLDKDEKLYCISFLKKIIFNIRQ